MHNYWTLCWDMLATSPAFWGRLLLLVILYLLLPLVLQFLLLLVLLLPVTARNMVLVVLSICGRIIERVAFLVEIEIPVRGRRPEGLLDRYKR